jgi:hypothetical protein
MSRNPAPDGAFDLPTSRSGARTGRIAALATRPRMLRPHSAPDPAGHLSVCPHCWNVNRGAARLCARCGADMAMALQESGGARRTAAVQSPVPVGVGARLGPLQRAVVAAFLALLALGQIMGGFVHHHPGAPRTPPPTQPVSR